MSDPQPDTPPDKARRRSGLRFTTPGGAPAENPSGQAPVDNDGGIEADEVDPGLEVIDPVGE